MGDNLLSTQCQRREISSSEKHAWRSERGPKLTPKDLKDPKTENATVCDTSLNARGCRGTKPNEMSDNLLSTHCPYRDISAREKYAWRSELGPKVAPVKDLKDPATENAIVAHR